MKKGTNVGLDKNYKNVCVGDQIKDADGYIYTIDRFGKAVGKGGSAFKLSEIQPFELYLPAPEAPEPDSDYVPTWQETTTVAAATYKELADELRRRGYEVTATKTTIVEL